MTLLVTVFVWSKQHKEGFLLFLLGPHIRPDNELLDGEVENHWSDCGVKYCTGQELVSEVNRKEVGLAGSVKSAHRESSLRLFLGLAHKNEIASHS